SRRIDNRSLSSNIFWMEAEASSPAHLRSKCMNEALHLRVAGEIRMEAARFVDRKMACDFLGEDRLTKSRKPGELAFMTQRDESERGRHRHIGTRDTVDRQGRNETFLAAVNR